MSFGRSFRRRINRKKEDSRGIYEPNLDKISLSTTMLHEAFSAPFNPDKIDEESRILQYLIIVGPHQDSPDKPSLLLVYPSFNFPFVPDSFNKLLKFLYPNGMYDMEILLKNNFVFTFSDDGVLHFGVCTHLNLKGHTHPFLQNADSSNAVCICTITSSPILTAHFQYHDLLSQILLGEFITPNPPDTSLIISDNIIFQSEEPKSNILSILANNLNSFQPPLLLSTDPQFLAAISPHDINPIFLTALDTYTHLKLTDQSYQFEISLGCKISIPSRNQIIKEIAWYSFNILFSLLSIQDIVRLFRAVFLEQSIILLSTNLTYVSAGALSIIPFLDPMTYQGTFLTVLPNDDAFLNILDSPIPFVLGLSATKDSLNKIQKIDKTNIVIINLDKDEVQYPESTPHMPGAEQLRQKLKKILKKRTEPVDPMFKLKFKEDLKYYFPQDMAESLFNVFQEHTRPWISKERICSCRARDLNDDNKTVVVFVEQTYLATIQLEDIQFIDFFERLIQTQTFYNYTSDLVQNSL